MKQKTFRQHRATRALAAVGLLCALSAGPVLAEGDAFVCMEASQERCDFENRNMDLFIQGRDAFERGRETGDLRQAHDYAAQLISRGDAKHGKGLMIYIYLQVAQGTHKNLVEAYRWVAADMAAGTTYPRIKLDHVLEQVAARMTPEQLEEAKQPK